MAYDIKSGKYIFDFDSVEFPMPLSTKVRDYLYPEYKGTYSHRITREQFDEILDGKDMSQDACRILAALVENYSTSKRLPSSDFDILSDSIISLEEEKFHNMTFTYEVHSGECKYNELIFDFKYKVRKGIDEVNNYEELHRENSKVRLKGHTFVLESYYMNEACENYLAKEKEKIEKQKLKERKDKELEKWRNFIQTHKQELIDWLLPLINNQKAGDICEGNREKVEMGVPTPRLVSILDRGKCYGCGLKCIFKDEIVPNGQHSKEWYDLGLDQFDFNYLY